jgi:uncharacterized protein YigE (DUF2233 family)
VIRAFSILGCASGLLAAAPITEESVEHAGVRFRVVKAEAADVQLVWKNQQGEPFRTFDKVVEDFSSQGKTVRMITNAGIYEPGGIPSGLHIEEGKILNPLNLRDAPGNFFLKPNGVFWIETIHGKVRASIAISEVFANRSGNPPTPRASAPRLAIQSGPLLLANGKRHPAFKQGSTNQLLRNGIGVDGDGRVVFAITDRNQYVNLYDFAGLFLKLNCKDALFLDGDISQMWVNPEGKITSNRFAAMFVLTE